MTFIERRLFFHLDWLLLAAVLAICAMGITMIYSATQSTAPRLYVSQLYALALGLIALLVALSIDYRTLADQSHFIYVAIVGLLVYVLLFGVVRGGARRWIPLGALQPAALRVRQARRRARARQVLRRKPARHADARRPADRRRVLAVVPLLLIARQPDLGTAVTLVPVYLRRATSPGLPMRILGILALAGVLAAPIAWKFALKDYQKSRISTFIDPSKDTQGAGYQQIQARITVGSGGLWGKGFMKGTQGQLRFLPVAHNDFIFSVLGRRTGLRRRVVALGLYLLVIMRSLEAARLAKDRLGAYPRAGHAGQLHVSGVLQRHDVRRPCAGEGIDAAAHELWRLVPDCDAGGLRPDPERPHAAVHQLIWPRRSVR